MSMYVLGINGSPRTGGNTDILLENALEGAQDSGAKTEKIVLNSLRFSACQECDKLSSDGTCVIEDDMQHVYRKVRDADALIMASPVFFGSLSAQTKMMIDRFQCAWRAKNILKKGLFEKKRIGVFLSVQASSRESFFDNARSIIKNFFAVVSAVYAGEVFCAGIDEKGGISKHKDCLKTAYELGQKITKMEV